MSKNINTAKCGNKGPKVRSDCHVEFTVLESGGIEIKLDSKVNVMFGKSIKQLCLDILNFYNIKNALLCVTDTGALPFVIAARIEAVIKKLIKTDKEYLLEMKDYNTYHTDKDIHRFSRLYLPGNSPSLMLNAGIHKPEGLILDLEDAVAVDKKFEARFLVRNALRQLNFYGAERMVRINQIPKGIEDIEYLIPHNVNLLLVPKCESADQILLLNKKIDEIKLKKGIKNPVWLMPIIESALGVIKSYEIASSADNIVSLAIGLEDYTADLGTKRTNQGNESFYARSQVVNSCRAAGVQPIDSVFSDVADMEALKKNVQVSKSLGFDGMGCIHPRQIKVVQENFGPDDVEIIKAKKIVNAFYIAEKKGLGVVSLGTKMIDPPVVKRAQKTIDLALSLGKLSKDWRKEFDV